MQAVFTFHKVGFLQRTLETLKLKPLFKLVAHQVFYKELQVFFWCQIKSGIGF
jgi:hypothetical protein